MTTTELSTSLLTANNAMASKKQTNSNEYQQSGGDTAPLIHGDAASSPKNIWQNKYFLAAIIITTILLLVVLLQFAWASTTTILLFTWRKQQPEIEDDPNLIHVIAFNDVYEINPVQYKGSEKRGGVSRVSQYVKNVKKHSKNVLVLFAGDMISPSLQSTLFNGKQMIETNNLLGINYAVLGNHEFDFGYDVLRDRVVDSKFKWMAANLRFVNNETAIVPLVDDNAMVQVGPVKIGLFGVVYDMRQSIKNATGMIFKDPFVTAAEQVNYLKKEGAQFVVALTHMFQEDDCKLSQRVPGIDLVIGGHDHLMQANYQCSPQTPYVKATQDYQNIWHLKINFGAKTNVPSIDFNNVPITTDLPTDPEVDALIAQYNAKTEDEFKVVLGVTETPIDTVSAALRSQETSGGNFVADVIRTSARADIGFINGGGIRSNRVFPAGSLNVGDVVAMLPFQNFVNLLRINGAILRAALEKGFCCIEEQYGGFPVISGFQVTYKKTGVPHVQSLQWLNGTDIQEEETFTMVTSDYMAGGGDGFTMFKNAEHIFDPVLDSTLVSGLVMNYIKEQKVIRPAVDGREKRLD